MDISKYNVKDTTICECGHKFDIHEINDLLSIDNHGFYSNIVKTCSLVNCPKCNTETVLLLKQKGQTWEILGIATSKEDKKTENISSNIINQTIEQTTIENKAEKNISDELICPVCEKVCKSKVGLNAHMKTHNK